GRAERSKEAMKVLVTEPINEKGIDLLKEHGFEVVNGTGIDPETLDVFEGNLPKADNPLLHMSNVIVTPHTAAFTVEALERMAYQAALGVVEVLEDKPVTYPVNQLTNSFEDNQKVSLVMDYYRYEFGSSV
ncbi:MAG: hypothetical protein SOX73_04115, partial [Porcincola intestinalis]|nr:hypothetical protein [Porcincola intestinalis]